MTRAAPGFFRELWRKYQEDHVTILVSSLAYYTFFSFFPILLVLASIIGFVYGMGEEYARLPRQLLGLLPFSSEYMANALDRIIRARRSLGFFGSVLLIWSATAAFDILQQILNRIHRAPPMRPLWRRRPVGDLQGRLRRLRTVPFLEQDAVRIDRIRHRGPSLAVRVGDHLRHRRRGQLRPGRAPGAKHRGRRPDGLERPRLACLARLLDVHEGQEQEPGEEQDHDGENRQARRARDLLDDGEGPRSPHGGELAE